MGCYVNSGDMSKEEWLKLHGVALSLEECEWEVLHHQHMLPVILIDNGLFKAAGIAFSPKELREFTMVNDPRPKKYYAVDIDELRTVCVDLNIYYKG